MYNYDKPVQLDAHPDDPSRTADGKYFIRIFIEESYAMNHDGYCQGQALKAGTMSGADYRLCIELGQDIRRHSVGWMRGPDGRPVAVFGQGSPREGQPIPLKYFPHLTAKVVKRATRGRRPFYKGPSVQERWRGLLHHLGMGDDA
jgi:hypothetical protein